MSNRIEQQPTQRFSLYLQPEGEAMIKLSAIMKLLAQQFDCPEFVPHVTVVPERWGTLSEIVTLTQKIAKNIEMSLSITLIEAIVGQSYFKCVFFTVAQTPEIISLAKRAREVFGVSLEELPFSPHFSMLYDGKDSRQTSLSIEQKQAAAQMLQEHVALPLTFACAGIAIHTSTPVVDEWQQVAFVPFAK